MTNSFVGEKITAKQAQELAGEVEKWKQVVKTVDVDREEWRKYAIRESEIAVRWRAEAMAGRKLIEVDGTWRNTFQTPTQPLEARATYAAARAANEGKVPVDFAVKLDGSDTGPAVRTAGVSRPDGGPEALYCAKFRHGGYSRPYDNLGLLNKDAPDNIGHITIPRSAFSWTPKP